jgi:glycosyltransferase involved in cell wall biosynthesis
MYKEKRIGVVIPAYNEAEFVGDVIETVPEYVDRVYPVDDNSTDETWREITDAAARVNGDERLVEADGGWEADRVVPLQHDRNRGVGAAIKTGYRRAASDDLDVVAVMNGDGQMDPEVLDRILTPVVEGRAGYAKGNRLLSADHWDGMPGWRLFGNFLLTYLTRIASGYWRTTDTQNGYTAISTDVIERLDLPSLYDEYGFLNDLLIRLNVHDVRIADVEMRAVYGEEDSSIRYTQFVPRLSWLLLRGFLGRLTNKYIVGGVQPVVLPYLFGIVGGALLVLSLPLLLLGMADGRYPSVATTAIGLASCIVLVALSVAFERRRNRSLQIHVRR